LQGVSDFGTYPVNKVGVVINQPRRVQAMKELSRQHVAQQVMKAALWPSRIKALAIAGAVISSFAFQPLTPAQAAALWTQNSHNASRTLPAAPRAGNDPAYHPPAKHGTSYTAPTPKAKSGSTTAPSEKTNLRTRNSRTFSSGGRQLTTLVYADSVNYRDSSGAWQAIDSSLVKTGLAHYAYQNKANRYTVYLPADLGTAPIRITFGSSWLTFGLQGAKGSSSMAGSVASYRNALPGVTVVVDAQADTLEESLVLQGPASPSQFTYELQMSPGLKLNPAGAGFSIVDASGRSVFGLAAPSMFDSAKNGGARSSAISLSATKDTKGTAVTLKADPAWLASAARKWPVTIDPTFLVGDVQDCYINAGSPTTSFCGGAALNSGYDGTNASRALLQFSLAAIPTTDAVLSAKLLLYLGSASTSTATSLGAYQLTRTWTTGATWNAYDGTNSWTTAGGDFSGTAAATTNGIVASGVLVQLVTDDAGPGLGQRHDCQRRSAPQGANRERQQRPRLQLSHGHKPALPAGRPPAGRLDPGRLRDHGQRRQPDRLLADERDLGHDFGRCPGRGLGHLPGRIHAGSDILDPAGERDLGQLQRQQWLRHSADANGAAGRQHTQRRDLVPDHQ